MAVWPIQGSHPRYKPDMDRQLIKIAGGQYRQIIRSINATRDDLTGQQLSYPGAWEFRQDFLGKQSRNDGPGAVAMRFLLAREADGAWFYWYNPAVNPNIDLTGVTSLGRHKVILLDWEVSNRRMGLYDFSVKFAEVPLAA